MTTMAVWNDYAHIIVAIVDENLTMWYYPQAIFIDIDLLQHLQIKKERYKFVGYVFR
jgi:hypothetical protein